MLAYGGKCKRLCFVLNYNSKNEIAGNAIFIINSSIGISCGYVDTGCLRIPGTCYKLSGLRGRAWYQIGRLGYWTGCLDIYFAGHRVDRNALWVG